MRDLIQYLRDNRDLIKISAVAKLIDVDPGTMHRVITGDKHCNGYNVKIPDDRYDRLKAVVDRLRK